MDIENDRLVATAQWERGSKAIQKLESNLASQYGSIKDEILSLTETIAALEAEELQLNKITAEVQKEQELLNAAQAEHEVDLSTPIQYTDTRQKELFEMCLGLEFKLNADKTISLVFHGIGFDQEVEDKGYSLTVDIDKNGQWFVVSVESQVPGLDSLLSTLNTTSNFGSFCKSLRSKFKEHISTTATQPTDEHTHST